MSDEANEQPKKKRKSSKSPTQRSLAWCRSNEWTVAVVERWNQFARIRQDVFGFIDLLAIGTGGILAIQATAGAVANRVQKIVDEPRSRVWLESGGTIEVHGWTKRANGRYAMRRLRVYLDGGAMVSEEMRDGK
jgi:hypothetical protein